MRLLADVDRGAWLLDRVGAWGRVGGVAGTGFEAYARILHPVDATRVDVTAVNEWGSHPVAEEARWRWSDVACRVGRVMHPLVQWYRLTDDEKTMSFADGWHIGQSDEGWFAPDLLATLTAHLDVVTRTPDETVAGIWNGWGELNGPPSVYTLSGSIGDPDPDQERRERERQLAEHRAAVALEIERAARAGPHLEWPGREFLLFETSLTELADPSWVRHAGIGWTSQSRGMTPQLVWPEDRSWVVATEIDWDSTIVAGPRTLVDAVIADDRFEAYEVAENADLTWYGDTINTH